MRAQLSSEQHLQLPIRPNRYGVPRWVEQGVRASPQAWQRFRELLVESATAPPCGIRKAELATAAWDTGLLDYPKTTIENWLLRQKPRDEVLVDAIQALCLGWVKRAPRAVATEEVVRLVAHLGGISRELVRRGLDRPLATFAGTYVPVSVELDARHAVRADLLRILDRGAARVIAVIGGSTQAWQEQVTLLYAQDVVHERFRAMLVTRGQSLPATQDKAGDDQRPRLLVWTLDGAATADARSRLDALTEDGCVIVRVRTELEADQLAISPENRVALPGEPLAACSTQMLQDCLDAPPNAADSLVYQQAPEPHAAAPPPEADELDVFPAVLHAPIRRIVPMLAVLPPHIVFSHHFIVAALHGDISLSMLLVSELKAWKWIMPIAREGHFMLSAIGRDWFLRTHSQNEAELTALSREAGEILQRIPSRVPAYLSITPELAFGSVATDSQHRRPPPFDELLSILIGLPEHVCRMTWRGISFALDYRFARRRDAYNFADLANCARLAGRAVLIEYASTAAELQARSDKAVMPILWMLLASLAFVTAVGLSWIKQWLFLLPVDRTVLAIFVPALVAIGLAVLIGLANGLVIYRTSWRRLREDMSVVIDHKDFDRL